MFNKPANRIDFDIPSELVLVQNLCYQFGQILDHNELSTHRQNLVLIAFEALNNACMHGNKCDRNRHIRGHFRIGKKWLELLVEDEGGGFSRSRPFLLPEPSEESGRGLYIMQQLATNLCFNRKGNRVLLRIRISGKSDV